MNCNVLTRSQANSDESVRGLANVELAWTPECQGSRNSRELIRAGTSALRERQPIHGSLANGYAWLLSAALLSAGSASAQILDPTSSPSFSDTVRAIARQADGTIIVGGSFNTVNGPGRFALARLSDAGILQPDLAGTPDNVVRAISVNVNNRIVIGGEFEELGAFATRNVARLLANGALDTDFVSGLTSGASGEIRWVGNLPNGQIVVAGSLSTTTGLSRIALLNTNGSVAPGFDPPTLDSIDSMAVIADNLILVAGSFDGQIANCTSNCVARLRLNGSVDPSFNATNFVGLAPSHMSLQVNGTILVTGNFSKVGNHNTFFIGRLLQNGGADTSFTNIDMRNVGGCCKQQRSHRGGAINAPFGLGLRDHVGTIALPYRQDRYQFS